MEPKRTKKLKAKSNVVPFPIRFRVGDLVRSTKITDVAGVVVRNFKDDSYEIRFSLPNGGEFVSYHASHEVLDG